LVSLILVAVASLHDVRSSDLSLHTSEHAVGVVVGRVDERLAGAGERELQVELQSRSSLAGLAGALLATTVLRHRVVRAGHFEGVLHDLRDVVTHGGRRASGRSGGEAFRVAVRGRVAQLVFLPLEQGVVDRLLLRQRRERSLGRGDVGDDIRDIFLLTNNVIGLILSTHFFFSSRFLVGCYSSSFEDQRAMKASAASSTEPDF
jgi:hypothetical protein